MKNQVVRKVVVEDVGDRGQGRKALGEVELTPPAQSSKEYEMRRRRWALRRPVPAFAVLVTQIVDLLAAGVCSAAREVLGVSRESAVLAGAVA